MRFTDIPEKDYQVCMIYNLWFSVTNGKKKLYLQPKMIFYIATSRKAGL